MEINDRYGMFACVTRSRHLELWHWPMEALALPSNSGRALPSSKTYLCIDCYTGLYKDKAPTLEIEFVSPTAHAFHVTLLCTPAVYFQSQHPLFILTSKVDWSSFVCSLCFDLFCFVISWRRDRVAYRFMLIDWVRIIPRPLVLQPQLVMLLLLLFLHLQVSGASSPSNRCSWNVSLTSQMSFSTLLFM